MKYIKRAYVDELVSVIGTPDIKVITGMRRAGKSVILEEFADYVKSTDKKANIIYINYSSVDFDNLRNYRALNDFVESHYSPKMNNYLLIDEIQMCEQFELAINSLHSSSRYDIYITGSNAFLLSSDLATLFTGRAYPIEVYPFSFKEYLEYYPEKKDRYDAFDDYFADGGLAGSYRYSTTEQKRKYVENVYDTIVMRDIVEKHNVQNPQLLRRISEYLTDNISNLTTSRGIADALTSNQQPTNNKTVGTYVDYLRNAFVFYPVRRYDVKGKAYLYSQEKYYLSDHSIKSALLGAKDMDYGRVYENIVAIELLRRGYEIYVGILRNKEIDFVAQKNGEKLYVQVSYDLTKNGVIERETTPLLSIQDAYPKILIAKTRQPEYSHEGIRVIDIADWLAE